MLIHKTKTKDDEKEIIPDGGIVRVSIMALDSVQQQIANQPAMDERVRDNLAANRATLAAMQRDADRAQGFADHFTAQRKAQADNSAYANYTRQISEAWQVAA